MISDGEMLALVKKHGVMMTDGHFVYTSGLHGKTYINKDALYPHTNETLAFCMKLAHRFISAVEQNLRPDVVIAPAIGGVILSQWIAYCLSQLTQIEVLSAYAEKTSDGKGFVIQRGYEKLLPRKNVLVVEDVLTTGQSARKVIEAVRGYQGVVVGLAVLFNRGTVTMQQMGNPYVFSSLMDIPLEAWSEADCSLCARGIPVNTSVGKGKDFLARKNAEHPATPTQQRS